MPPVPPVLITRHAAHEGPGYFIDFLNRHNIPWQLLAIDNEEIIPTSIDGHSGLVMMGGPMSVNDPLPWIAPLIKLIRNAFENNVPVLGHCLGGQMMAKALGAKITRNPVPEYGFLPVEVVDKQAGTQWLDGIGQFEALHWHGETFDIPEGATHLLSSKYCTNQAFVIGPSLALQCHIEMTSPLVMDWVGREQDSTLTPADSTQDREAILTDLDAKIMAMHAIADIIYGHWICNLRRSC